MKTGSELIAEERQRQISQEGWTSAHDDAEHDSGQLTEAAICYAAVGSAQSRGASADEWPVEMFDGFHDSVLQWPFDDCWYKPKPHALGNLVKAGALIAAEIDRLQRRGR